MRMNVWIVPCMALLLAIPAAARDKKKHVQRAMVENMVAVPCGAKSHGITGIGSLWASAGLEHVNSDEKLCPQYLLRTDDMEYMIRPQDRKHPVLLPVGQEGEFKIKKDRLFMKVVDGDKKTRAYQVVSINQLSSTENAAASSGYHPPATPSAFQAPTVKPGEGIAKTRPPQ